MPLVASAADRGRIEPSRARIAAGRLIVRLGAGGWIVTFIIAAITSSTMDSALTGGWVVVVPMLFIALLLMTFAGILMSIAMLIAIVMDFGVRVRRRMDGILERAGSDRRSPTIDLDAPNRDTETWRGF